MFFRSSHVLNKSFTFAYLPLKSNHHTSDVGATPFLFHLTAKAVFGEFFFSLGVNEVFFFWESTVNDTFTLGVRLPTCQPTRKGLCGAKPKIRLHSGETILHNYSLLSLSLHRLFPLGWRRSFRKVDLLAASRDLVEGEVKILTAVRRSTEEREAASTGPSPAGSRRQRPVS